MINTINYVIIQNNGHENAHFTCILDPGVDPCITIQNNAATGISSVKAGTGFTWNNT